MAGASGKAQGAFLTIGEVATELGLPQHILRYWEPRFPQLRPLQRAGNRRYYRPADVALAHRIHRLLNQDGYTIRGVQQLLASGAPDGEDGPIPITTGRGATTQRLRTIRRKLNEALDEDQG